MATYWATVTTPNVEQHHLGVEAESHAAARDRLADLVASKFPQGTAWLLNHDPAPDA